MRRLWVLGLLVVVLVGIVAFPGPAVVSAQSVNESSPVEENFTETQFVITVFENGSARFTQRYNQPLSNETEIRRFRAYAEKFESEETPLYTDFTERAMALTEEGSNATGREMDARGFTRQARVVSQPTATGVVEMSFIWTNFTAAEDGRIVVGTVFERGLYLSSGMSLTIEAGPDLEIVWESVEPEPDASSNGTGNATDSLTYFGEQQFASGHPRVAFVPDSAVVVNGSPLPGPMVWAAGALVVVLALGAVVIRRSGTPLRRSDETTDAATTTDASDTDTSDADTDGTNEETTPPEPAITDAALRSDEDRVTALLEENGGRMQQSAIVVETGWSKSKVSMLLTEMENDGQVSKLRIGRENIVSLAGHEPEAAGSPFEDG